MKHVKLFEAFGEAMESEKMIVIGVLSEGCDVAMFPKEIGEEVWAHISSLKSWYYKPFRFDLDPNDPVIGEYLRKGGRLFLVVNADPSMPLDWDSSGGDQYRKISKTVTVGVMTDWDISQLQGNNTPISVFQAPPVTLETDIESIENYAMELVGGDQYMSVQSWGQGLESGAYKHFMGMSSDEIEGKSMWD